MKDEEEREYASNQGHVPDKEADPPSKGKETYDPPTTTEGDGTDPGDINDPPKEP